jgi:hypothetical protein
MSARSGCRLKGGTVRDVGSDGPRTQALRLRSELNILSCGRRHQDHGLGGGLQRASAVERHESADDLWFDVIPALTVSAYGYASRSAHLRDSGLRRTGEGARELAP